MAFNLEFKITYDELAPSLQDMFKSLQGQITDNRNEITNINLDISDITNEINNINNHLTQIDNSITNIENDITNIEGDITEINKNITQIEGDITNLGDQITEINNNITIINDKLEEAKIGFYQDDTIEVISKYNMNYQYRQYVIYHDNKGQEVLYFGGNDGSYKQTNTYYPFKGIRTDQNSPFVFKNSPLNIPLIDGGKYALAFLSCGNYFMIVAVADKDITSQTQSLNDFKLYLYDTHYSSDESIWEGKNIYPLIYNTVNEQIYGSANAQIVSSFILNSNIRFYYNYDKKLLFAFYIKVEHVLNKPNEHPFTILVFNMNNNSFIRKIEMPNLGKYIGCSNSFSFNTTKQITEIDSSETNINNNLTEGWESWRIIWFPKQELFKVSVRDKTVNYCNWPYNGYTRYDNYSMVFTYRVPIALWNSGSNVTITDYNTRQYGPGLPNDRYGAVIANENIYIGYRNNYAISRDEMNSISIFSSRYPQENFKVLYEKNNIARVDDTTVKDDDRGWLYYGNKFSTIPAKFLLTTDASIWGKGWTYGLSINNMVQLSCYSNQNSVCTPNNIMVSKFQFVQDTTDEYDHPTKVVRAAEYTLMNKDNVYSYENPSGGGSLPVFSYEACIRFSNTIENSPRYCHTGISSGTDGVHLSSHYIQLSSDKKYYNNPIAGPSIIFKPPRYQGNGTTNYYLNEEYGTKQEFRGAFYNPFGDFYFYGLRDLGAAGTKTRNKFYFIVIEGNGKAHYFGQDFESSWNSNFINSMNGIANSQYEIVNNCVSCLCFNSRTIQFLLRFTNNSLNNTYGIRINVKLTFNQDFSNFTMETPRNPPGIGPDNNFSTTYGGDTIGFISCNRNWLQSPLMIYTQKPLPGVGGGTSYTIDQYLYEAKFNKYKIYTESNQGLLGYVPSTNIFLGGYYTVIQNPIQLNCIANNDNYVYLERGEDRDTINAIVSTTLYQEEGERMFSRICIAKITCNSETITAVEYYRINIGYNDYIWNGGGGNN